MHRIQPSAVLLTFSLASVWGACLMGLGRIDQPGPGLFPFICSGALVLVSLAMILRISWGSESPTPKMRGGFKRVLMVALGVSVLGLLIECLGLAPGVFVILFFFWFYIEGQRWPKVLIMSALSALFCHLLFDALLGVHFPRGILGF